MILIALAATAALAPSSPVWASFSRDGMVSEVVEISSRNDKSTRRLEYRLRLTTRKIRGRKPEIRLADSMECPVVRSVILGMHEVTMPTPAPYGGPNDKQIIVLDGAEYALTAPSTFPMGKLTITSTDDTPLATWINSALKQLAPCWKAFQGE